MPFEELVALIAEILDEEQPVVVATFGADGIFGHPDHTAVGAVASRIVAGLRGTAGCNVSPGVGASSARGDGSPAQPVTAVVGHRQRGGHRRTGEEEQHVAD